MKSGCTTEQRVLKHGVRSRLFHWALIIGFIPAAITGFMLWLKTGDGVMLNLAMKVHVVGAAIVTLAAVLYTLFAFDRVVMFLRLIFTWTDRDVGWMLVGGGYPQKMLLGKKVEVPPMGKLNSGQKLFGIAFLFGGIALVATGWILYAFIPVLPKAVIYWADMVHLVIGVVVGLMIVPHVFLGVYNWGECKAMLGDGTQALTEVEEHCPLWVEHQLEPAGNTPVRAPEVAG